MNRLKVSQKTNQTLKRGRHAQRRLRFLYHLFLNHRQLVNSVRQVGRGLHRRWPIVLFALISVGIFLPVLGRGYILRYDMVFVPHPLVDWTSLSNGSSLYSSVPLQAALQAASHILPMDIVQKLILVGIFFGAMVAFYSVIGLRSRSARVLGAVAYALNPFTYDRLLAGHWLLLAAYALTPLVAHAFYRLACQPDKRRLLVAAGMWSLAALLSPHHLLILAVLYVGFMIAYVRSRRSLVYMLSLPLLVLFLNSWWLVPLLVSHNLTSNFGLSQFYVFATHSDSHFGLWLNMLALQGFWYHGGWRSYSDFYKWLPGLIFLWLVPAFVGLGSLRLRSTSRRRYVLALLIASLLALIIASGPAPPFGALNAWDFSHLPGLSGLREPEKLLGLVSLTYAVLIAYGCDTLLRQRRALSVPFALSASLIIALMAAPLLGGANGQLKLSYYPAAWQTLSQQLSHTKKSERVIILPRDLYINRSFTGSLVANPANSYFGARAIASYNSGLSGVIDYRPAGYSQLDQALARHNGQALRVNARKLKAHYLLLTKSQDDKYYKWLDQLPGLKLLHNDSKTTIWHLTY